MDLVKIQKRKESPRAKNLPQNHRSWSHEPENILLQIRYIVLHLKTGLLGDRFVTILGTKDPTKVSPEGITSRLRISANGGKTWQRMEQALAPVEGIYNMDERLAQVKDVYDIIQVGMGAQLFCSFDTGIYRSADQGKTWELVLPSKGKWSFRLAVSGGMIYAVPGGGC